MVLHKFLCIVGPTGHSWWRGCTLVKSYVLGTGLKSKTALLLYQRQILLLHLDTTLQTSFGRFLRCFENSDSLTPPLTSSVEIQVIQYFCSNHCESPGSFCPFPVSCLQQVQHPRGCHSRAAVLEPGQPPWEQPRTNHAAIGELLSSLGFLVKTHFVSVLLQKRVLCDPRQLIARVRRFLLISVPSWFDTSHKQQKNFFHVDKWVFQVAAPALTAWSDPSVFWDVSAFLPTGSGEGWALPDWEKRTASNFYPVGYRWILEKNGSFLLWSSQHGKLYPDGLGTSVCLWPISECWWFLGTNNKSWCRHLSSAISNSPFSLWRHLDSWPYQRKAHIKVHFCGFFYKQLIFFPILQVPGYKLCSKNLFHTIQKYLETFRIEKALENIPIGRKF